MLRVHPCSGFIQVHDLTRFKNYQGLGFNQFWDSYRLRIYTLCRFGYHPGLFIQVQVIPCLEKFQPNKSKPNTKQIQPNKSKPNIKQIQPNKFKPNTKQI